MPSRTRLGIAPDLGGGFDGGRYREAPKFEHAGTIEVNCLNLRIGAQAPLAAS
jgi:hypothetical protein